MANQDVPKKQDKVQLKRAALRYWSDEIHIAATNACTAIGGLDKATPLSGSKFYCVVRKMKRFIRELDAIAAAGVCENEEREKPTLHLQAQQVLPQQPPPTQGQSQQVQSQQFAVTAQGYYGYGCEMDEDCPDGQICIDGVCDSPFS